MRARAGAALLVVLLAALVCGTATQPEEDDGLDPDEFVTPEAEEAARLAAEEALKARKLKKPDELRDLAAFPPHIVQLENMERYEYFTQRPRRYHMIVLFTSNSGRCEPCGIIGPYFERVAAEWREANPDDTTLFFATVDHAEKDAQEIFTRVNVRQAPLVVHIGPTRKGVEAPPFSLPEDQHPLTSSWSWTPEGLAKFVRKRTGAELYVENTEGAEGPPMPGAKPPKKVEGITSQVVTYVCAALVISFVGFSVYQQAQAHKDNTIWFFASVIVLWFLISGFAYNIITNAPPFVSRADGLVIFHPFSHSQFGLEGLIMGFLTTSVGLLVLLLNVWLPMSSHDTQTKDKHGIILVTAIIVLFYVVRTVYAGKNQGYLVHTEMAAPMQ